MRKSFILFTLMIVPLSSFGSSLFESKMAGLRLTKPESWFFISAEENWKNLEKTKMSNEEFQQAMLKYATTPLVAITKYKEPFNDLNPSLKINIKPLGQLHGASPLKIAELIVPSLKQAFPDLKVIQTPKEVLVGGLKGTYIHVQYLLKTQAGPSFPTSSEIWIVPKGNHFFMIGAGTRQDEKTGTRKEISQIVQSIQFFD